MSQLIWSRRSTLYTIALTVLVLASFAPTLSNDWVNFDDPETIVENDALLSPGVVPWAFTTDRMSHFQPVSWLVWSAAGRFGGMDPSLFHGVSLFFHALNVLLLYGLLVALTKAEPASFLGALLYAVHPLRVEPVAWASALPYLAATSFLLASALLYLRGSRLGSFLAYAGSLLARPIAFAFPLVLLALDYRARRRLAARDLLEKLPFLAAAVAGFVLEARARPFAGIDAFGIPERFTLASSSFLDGLLRFVWPLGLTPLDPLPIEPALDVGTIVLAAALLGGAIWATIYYRRHLPSAPLLFFCWFALLAPSLGFFPSGLQATADRYSYVPGLVVALAVAGLLATARSRSFLWAGLAVGLLLTGLTYRQCRWWKDSMTLWDRAVALDSKNDLALYFGASALAEAGRFEEARARYRALLDLVPDHRPARVDLARLEVRQANALAEKGELDAAIERYQDALGLDPELSEAREGHAMALFQAGRFDEALSALEVAYAAGGSHPEVASALAALRNARGDPVGAVGVLEEGLSRFPEDVGLAGNLARLLATREDLFPGRAEEAVRLAREVVARTGGRDPRALDTLATALARAGSSEEALQLFEVARRRAADLGWTDLAEEIAAHSRALSR